MPHNQHTRIQALPEPADIDEAVTQRLEEVKRRIWERKQQLWRVEQWMQDRREALGDEDPEVCVCVCVCVC